MTVPGHLRRPERPWILRGSEIAGVVRGLRTKATPLHRRAGRYAGSRRVILWLFVSLLAAAVGGSLMPAENVASASLASRHGTSGPSASQLPVRPLDTRVRGRSYDATVGAVPFAAAPPKHRKHSAAAPSAASAGVPAAAIAAYEHAQIALSLKDPSCHLSWEDVAGIGRVESDNGQTWGTAARVTSDGTLFPAIFGIPLNGLNGTPAMPAPHGGWVRAEGPMQFLPATWAEYSQAGQRNPQNFFDAALSTGVFLCVNGGNLNTAASLTAAIFSYNHSDAYVALVKSWISFYGQVGVRALTAAGSGLLPTGTPITSAPRPAKPRARVTPKPRTRVTPVAHHATSPTTTTTTSTTTTTTTTVPAGT